MSIASTFVHFELENFSVAILCDPYCAKDAFAIVAIVAPIDTTMLEALLATPPLDKVRCTSFWANILAMDATEKTTILMAGLVLLSSIFFAGETRPTGASSHGAKLAN